MSQTVALTQNVLRQQHVLALVCACGAMLALLEDEYCQPYCTDRLTQRYPQFVLHLRTCMALEWRSLAPAATPTLHKRDYLSTPVMGWRLFDATVTFVSREMTPGLTHECL